MPGKNGSLTFCVQYQKLQAVLCQDWCAYLRVSLWVDHLAEVHIFSTLDPSSGYLKLKSDHSRTSKTAFTSPHGPFQCAQMVFGFNNTLVSFLQVMVSIIYPFNGSASLVYVDYMVVFANNVNNRMAHLRKVPTWLERQQLTTTWRSAHCLLNTGTTSVMLTYGGERNYLRR